MRRSLVLMITVIGLAMTALLLGSCSRTAGSPESLPATLSAPAGQLPDAVYRAGPQAIDAYRAALSDPDVLAAVPCLCGCQESLGHRNNLDCYIAGKNPAGGTVYSSHGIDCGVCQTITQIAMDGARQGLSGDQLRQLVLDHYGAQP